MLTKIEIEIEEETKTMLDLALLLSKVTMQDAFKEFADYYVKKVLYGKVNKQQSEVQEKYENEQIDATPEYRYVNNEIPSNNDKVIRRLPLWAKRNSSYIHHIICAYFATEQDGVASLSDMYDVFSNIFSDVTRFTFHNNVIALTSDKGNASGHLFNLSDDKVTIFEPVIKYLNQYKHYFIKGE